MRCVLRCLPCLFTHSAVTQTPQENNFTRPPSPPCSPGSPGSPGTSTSKYVIKDKNALVAKACTNYEANKKVSFKFTDGQKATFSRLRFSFSDQSATTLFLKYQTNIPPLIDFTQINININSTEFQSYITLLEKKETHLQNGGDIKELNKDFDKFVSNLDGSLEQFIFLADFLDDNKMRDFICGCFRTIIENSIKNNKSLKETFSLTGTIPYSDMDTTINDILQSEDNRFDFIKTYVARLLSELDYIYLQETLITHLDELFTQDHFMTLDETSKSKTIRYYSLILSHSNNPHLKLRTMLLLRALDGSEDISIPIIKRPDVISNIVTLLKDDNATVCDFTLCNICYFIGELDPENDKSQVKILFDIPSSPKALNNISKFLTNYNTKIALNDNSPFLGALLLISILTTNDNNIETITKNPLVIKRLLALFKEINQILDNPDTTGELYGACFFHGELVAITLLNLASNDENKAIFSEQTIAEILDILNHALTIKSIPLNLFRFIKRNDIEQAIETLTNRYSPQNKQYQLNLKQPLDIKP